MANIHTNPAGVSAPTGYTHVVIGQPGRVVYLSGQVAVNAQGEIVGAGDFTAQATQVFENLRTCLAAAGATFADVVKLTTYIVNFRQDLRPALAEIRARYLGANPPASTLVGVQALALPELMIEIEAVAVLE